MKLLKQLCSIHAPSGEEFKIKEFVLWWVSTNSHNWKVKPFLLNDSGVQV